MRQCAEHAEATGRLRVYSRRAGSAGSTAGKDARRYGARRFGRISGFGGHQRGPAVGGPDQWPNPDRGEAMVVAVVKFGK